MKLFSSFIFLFFGITASAQNISDVLHFSSENTQGTARFQAMSGAFGSLGGDLSALNINPAGSAIFSNHQATFTGALYNNKNNVTFNNSPTNSGITDVDINQAGGVLVFNSSVPESDWNKFSLAINYDITQKYDDEIYAAGSSNEGIDQYFLDFADGVAFRNIRLNEGEFIEDAYLDIGSNVGFRAQQAFLGFQAAIIDPVNVNNENNTTYIYNPDASYNNLNQDFIRTRTGFNSKFTINGATAYKEKLFLGASLNFHSIVQTKYDEYTETGYNSNSDIQRITFDNLLSTQGRGFSFSLGAIAKVNNLVRFGASYQSPTWYRIEDELSQRISSDASNANGALNFINFNLTNIFPRYTLKTPGKLTGSLAFVFGKDGLLSFDYSYQDMSQSKLGPSNDANFSAVNSTIPNQLVAVNSFRIGGEYRIERFSLRAGYRFEGSPYKNGDTIGDLKSISTGLGYNFGSSRLDFGINRTERDFTERLFDTGINTGAIIEGVHTNATLSYTVNF